MAKTAPHTAYAEQIKNRLFKPFPLIWRYYARWKVSEATVPYLITYEPLLPMEGSPRPLSKGQTLPSVGSGPGPNRKC
jgi:hypothetical protein